VETAGEEAPETWPHPQHISFWVIQEGTAVTGTGHPRTIHDFTVFLKSSGSIEYPAPGSMEEARMVQSLVKSINIDPDYE
jgi:4,5-DOPA dioxygenase extradiol